jgi:uncharacterized protein YciI
MFLKVISLMAVVTSLVLYACESSIRCEDESKGPLADSLNTRTQLQDESLEQDGDSAVKYDAKLAQELGADEYGMKNYVFVLLKTGKVTIGNKDESNKVFAGHFSNMKRLANEGKLVLAGPFVEGEKKRGLFILDVKTIKEAEELVKSDPAVAAGVLDYELTKLYCSAALMKVTEIHKAVQKNSIQ